MKIIEYSKALYKTARYQILDGITEDNKLAAIEHAEIVDKINDDGIIVIDNFYSAEKCDVLIKEIDRLLIDKKDKVQGDALGADNRIFGADRASDLIHNFFTNEFISAIKDAYHKKNNIIGFTLAARINAAKNNLGSGGGWHRDSIYGKQFKAIIYLTDTSEENGPFQYIPETHKPLSKVKTVAKYKIKAFQNRISQEEIDFIIDNSEYEISTLTGKKGTLILTDTTGIHRGKPLEKGCRYALTNYYFEGKIPEHIGKLLLKK
jgi:hypothetical protein